MGFYINILVDTLAVKLAVKKLGAIIYASSFFIIILY